MLGKAIAGCSESMEGEVKSNCPGLLTVNDDYDKCFKTPVVDEPVLGKLAALPGYGSAGKPKILSPAVGYLSKPPPGSCQLSSAGPQGAQCKVSDASAASAVTVSPSVITTTASAKSTDARTPAFTKPASAAQPGSAQSLRVSSLALAFALFVAHRQR